jgi:hypothetical protein
MYKEAAVAQFETLSCICLESLRKTTDNFIRDIRSPGWGVNSSRPENEGECYALDSNVSGLPL